MSESSLIVSTSPNIWSSHPPPARGGGAAPAHDAVHAGRADQPRGPRGCYRPRAQARQQGAHRQRSRECTSSSE